MEQGQVLVTFRKYRWALVPVLLLLLYVGGHFSGLADRIDAERLREWMQDEALWGVALFVGLFSVGELIHIPGILFVGVASYVYSAEMAVAVSLLGAIASVTVSFFVIRFVGGQPLRRVRWRFIRRALAHLDERPVLVVAALRAVLWLAPVVNYVLAMSHVRFRDYLLGSVIGLVPPVTAFALLFEYLPDALTWVSRIG